MSTATGTIAVRKDVLRNTLAALTAFQQWQKTPETAWDLATAKTHIYFDDLPPPPNNAAAYTAAELAALRPFAVIYLPEKGIRWTADAGPRHCRPSGELVMYFEESIPASLLPDPVGSPSDPPRTVEDGGEIIRRFENFIGRLVQSTTAEDVTFTTQRSEAGYTTWKQIEFAGPFRCPEDCVPSQGEHQWGLLNIHW
jgi:hypothetical protein